jgi:hypothetical protein
MKKEVLEKRRHILGEEHLDTMLAMNNLAGTLGDLGQLDKAVRMLKITVHCIKLNLGHKHLYTKVALCNLAWYSSAMTSEECAEASDIGKKERVQHDNSREGSLFVSRLKQTFYRRT